MIAGRNLPLGKRVEVGLTYIYGIGRSSSRTILEMAEIHVDTYVRDLTEAEIVRLRDIVDEWFVVEGDLRARRVEDVRRLIEIGCYRGLRHKQALPVRGQGTKRNARTRKGPRAASMAQRGKRKAKDERRLAA